MDFVVFANNVRLRRKEVVGEAVIEKCDEKNMRNN